MVRKPVCLYIDAYDVADGSTAIRLESLQVLTVAIPIPLPRRAQPDHGAVLGIG